MNTIPGFNGEASLSPTIGTYRSRAGFGGSGKGEVVPMQAFPAFATTSIEKTLRCCSWFFGRLYCTTYRVPFLENCRCQSGFPVCTPPVRTQF